VTATRWWTLAGIWAVTASVGWAGALLIDDLGRALPTVPGSAPTVLLLFAAILLALAVTTRSRLRAWRERRPGAQVVEPLTVARYAVLARASSPVGAGVVGLYSGYAVFLLPDLGEPGRRHLAAMSLFATGAGVAVGGAALFLERVCRLPGDGAPGKGSLPRPRDRAT
jgi:uncharacterized protein DUF3180